MKDTGNLKGWTDHFNKKEPQAFEVSQTQKQVVYKSKQVHAGEHCASTQGNS